MSELNQDLSNTVSIAVSATPQYSPIFNVDGIITFSLQWIYSGGVGTGTVQVSNNKTNFIDLTVTTLTFSGSDTAGFDITVTGFKFARLKFLSGTGMSGTLILNQKIQE